MMNKFCWLLQVAINKMAMFGQAFTYSWYRNLNKICFEHAVVIYLLYVHDTKVYDNMCVFFTLFPFAHRQQTYDSP